MDKKKPLIIAEKPSAAQAVAAALGGFRKRTNYLESDEYLLSWAVGHLVELYAPEDYDPRLKRWSMAGLPILPDTFKLKIASGTQNQFRTLAQLAQRASSLINACDAGREGELIYRYIITVLGADHLPARRLWVSSLTKEALRRGFNNLQPAAAYDRLYESALCRARGDWLVGMNATRAFTVRFGELFSVGRVQTPTLALLVRREAELRAFQPVPYWEVHAGFAALDEGAAYSGKWFGPDGDKLPTAAAAAVVVERVRATGRGHVADRTEKEVIERPPQLFDLTALQREANRRYGLTAAATLKAAQTLYEGRLITYPRTDSRYLSRDVADTVNRPLRALAEMSAYKALADGANTKLIYNGRVVNDAKVSDHHAIIPTGEPVPALTGGAAHVFDLIARRFLAQFYPEARFLEVELLTAVEADNFRSRGRQLVQAGWRVAEPPARAKSKGQEEEEEQLLPALVSGQPVQVTEVAAQEKTPQPPRRYTEAMLLGAMESAGKEIDDEALREAMKGRGLGTPATRAAIIERLKKVGYVTVKGKVLIPTEKGEGLVGLAAAMGSEELLSADLTGRWEKRIADIQAGTDDPVDLLAAMRDLAARVVNQVRTAAAPAPADPLAALLSVTTGPGVRAGTCPYCGNTVIRKSREWRCQGAQCRLRIPARLCEKNIDVDLAGVLLREGRSQLITGFVSPRTGNPFQAFLVLQPDGVKFEFTGPPAGKRRWGGARRPGRAGEEADKRKRGSGSATTPQD